ncbi:MULTISPECIES: hypothetical protein [unclassified Polaromonas]|jgi:hypothetical protein|uniref:hypothetical protein n=1 Tax=unclassified Polaromonas TaxID=2638319 RepID=UPI000BCD267A|nr:MULTISPECIES: hypothetical protein [unclassified Polaromonas]OYY34770.1 MAG: hypothetical protein B7Y60_15130 [Polaromonas sp. 35-63-35]OYZ19343.1 MAG: hypothetical protein B7Y28_12460 [Polaromonas sp. 16-63-31]OYZ77530.1 MAG: hypothetical protein B7Y09_16285 [Polaromonas sp. 24-63-21]OZA48486.1 MAG: hypothetical protein B7X88_18230 [Polaromonas sp. 17-63-33]OZA87235.1 MAG: hypothetical protein B7X65_13705 [Polaromonas sp. 39-63-25]
MTVTYEWDIEETIDYTGKDDGLNDVLDHLFQPDFKSLKSQLDELKAHDVEDGHVHYDPVLVRDDDNGRSWAYLIDGKLPTHFEDAYQNPVAKVPARFHKEVSSA